MIEVYSFPTPNGHKVHILLEELGLPYRLHKVDIFKDEQFAPDFLRISPNNKIPAIVDPDGPGGDPMALFESGLILEYLAVKAGRFIPTDPRPRWVVKEWLMFQMAGLGPMLGQAHHFRVFAPEKVPYAINRYTQEAARLYGVLNRRLQETGAFLGGAEYSIADIACWPWIRSHERQGQRLEDFPAVRNWFAEIADRPAVKKGVAVFGE
ncbi:MAG TPA: glutathione S-transferase N-terminal domain-containing protein [Dongiaceae bacterium]|jgi:GST-like protein|nr:glutathione S-transferase N-terminal domain-containing protein [Dongiaceae bacterium]